jgi:hypothetical protein
VSKWDGLEVVGRFCFAGWFFDIPIFYRSIALSDDEGRRKMSPDFHLTDVTAQLPSYSKAWWTDGQKLVSIEDILSLDCSQVSRNPFSTPFRFQKCSTDTYRRRAFESHHRPNDRAPAKYIGVTQAGMYGRG